MKNLKLLLTSSAHLPNPPRQPIIIWFQIKKIPVLLCRQCSMSWGFRKVFVLISRITHDPLSCKKDIPFASLLFCLLLIVFFPLDASKWPFVSLYALSFWAKTWPSFNFLICQGVELDQGQKPFSAKDQTVSILGFWAIPSPWQLLNTTTALGKQPQTIPK